MLIKYKKILCSIAAVGVLTIGIIGTNNGRKNKLRELIQSDTLDSSMYTPITYQQYSEHLAAAISISDELFTASDKIDEAYTNLQSSIEQLQHLPDKSNLQELYIHSININQNKYIPESLTALQNAVAIASDILSNPNSTLDDVNSALNALKASLEQLILKPDKKELCVLLDTASEIDAALFLPNSYSVLALAIQNGNSVFFNENALENDVKKATIQLQQSIEQLVTKPDKSLLLELLSKAESSSEEQYTTSSFAALQQSIDSVTKIFNDNNATQEQVSTSEKMLQSALDNLVKSTKGIYEINIWFSRESNDHVGNSWFYDAFYNNTRIDGNTLTVKPGTTISIFCKIVEEDNIPDVGRGYLSLRMEDGAESSLTISVYENRGRYSGHRAVWIVTATATLIERV